MLLRIIFFSLLGSVGSVLAAGAYLWFPRSTRERLIPWLISFATGTLLGVAFLGLIPEAAAETGTPVTLHYTLGGIILFFVLEKLVLWRHCHQVDCEVHSTHGPLILMGDAVHNLVDGVVIAAAFLNSPALGVTAALATILHEIPQEVGDFGILLNSGYQPLPALLLNTLSGLATLPGALLGYFFLTPVQNILPYVLALAAGSFIYIAAADLIPTLHQQTSLKISLRQLAFMLAGIVLIVLLHD